MVKNPPVNAGDMGLRRTPHIILDNSPCSLQLEKACSQQQRPSRDKTTTKTRDSIELGIQFACVTPLTRDKKLGLIFRNIFPVAIGDKNFLQNCY